MAEFESGSSTTAADGCRLDAPARRPAPSDPSGAAGRPVDLHPCDQLQLSRLLSDAERAVLGRLREVLDATVRPLLAEFWERGEFPYQVMPELIALNLMDPPELGAEPSAFYAGFRTFELARTDASIAALYNAQAGLFRTVVRVGAAPAVAVELDRRIRRFELTGVFALTEPDRGSDIAGGLATTARRDGTGWVIDGAKRWIGAAADALGRGLDRHRGPGRRVRGRGALHHTAVAVRPPGGRIPGGNGITLEADVARFHADAEAIYSYEGTHEINALIVGRSITGLSAFTR